MQYYLESQDMITSAKVQNRTGDFTICYKGDREKVIKLLQTFRYEEVDIPENYVQNSGRELNQEYWDKLVESVIYHYGNKLFFYNFGAIILRPSYILSYIINKITMKENTKEGRKP